MASNVTFIPAFITGADRPYIAPVIDGEQTPEWTPIIGDSIKPQHLGMDNNVILELPAAGLYKWDGFVPFEGWPDAGYFDWQGPHATGNVWTPADFTLLDWKQAGKLARERKIAK